MKHEIIHRFELTACFADTDAGGVVYHTRYLELFERARFDFFQKADPASASFSHDRGGYAVADLSVHYRKPARLGERVAVETSLMQLKRASFTLKQRAAGASNGDLFCEAEVNMVRVNRHWKPEAISDRIREALGGGRTISSES